jgi:Type VI secretion system/phage-baseplate injector OB domain
MNRDFLKNVAEGLEQYGKYYATYYGIVAENDDPEKRGRLKLKVPEVFPDDITDWAFGKSIYNSDKTGIFAIPAKGSAVFVSFINGNAAQPIWEFGWFADQYMPKEFKDNYLNTLTIKQEKILILQTDCKIELDDKGIKMTKGKVEIELSDKIIIKQGSTQIILDNGIGINYGALSLKSLLTDLLACLKTLKVMVGTAPSGPITPDTLATITTLELRTNQLLK